MSGSVWGRRRARAIQLLREAPHAEELLVFYAELAEVQGRVAERVPVEAWLQIVRSDEDDGPPLRRERLGPDELMPLFELFLGRLGDAGTEVIRARTVALMASEARARDALLAEPEGFHGRAFHEAVTTTLAAALSPHGKSPLRAEDTPPGSCLVCGSLPLVAILRDLPDALGARSLACSLCSTEWRVNRLQCAHCGETSAEKLSVHTAESIPHVRVDECLSCGRYMKTVDFRRRGDAVPLVDELAAVELDLWAQERGLRKVRTNLLDL